MTDEKRWTDGNERKRTAPQMSGGASPVYGLGMIGALVYYWSRAEGGKGKAGAVGKSLVWPAFVVHDLLRHLDG